MKSNTTTTMHTLERSDNRTTRMTKGEQGRRLILMGWLVTMVGIVCYIVAMSRAGESASILDAFTHQGLLGWVSALLLVGGVAIWFVGNFACLHDMARLQDDE